MKEVKKKLKMRLPAVFALVATLLFWGLYDRYVPVGQPLLEQPVLSEAFKVRGDIAETNGVFHLQVPAAGKSAEARFKLSGDLNYPYLRLTGRIRTENVVRGKHAWNSARLILIQRGADGKWISGDHRLLSEDGTVDWVDQVQEFEIDPRAVSVEVVVQHTGKSGAAWFDSVKAVPVKVRGSYPWFRVLFCVLWISMVYLYFRRCRLHTRKLRVLILLNVIVILYGTMLPSDWISNSTEWVKKQVPMPSVEKKDKPASKPVEQKPVKPVDKKHEFEQKMMGHLHDWIGRAHKMGHFVLFASLCFLVYCSAALEGQGASYYLKVAGDLLLFAAISESLQFLTLDRSPGFFDWMMDVYGMVVAFVVFAFGRFLVRMIPRIGKA